jgi:hypothetical protein
MEAYGQGYGYIAYTTKLNRDYNNAELFIESLGDRAQIYVNRDLYDTKASASAFGNTFNDYAIGAKAVAFQIYLKDGQRTVTEIYYTGEEEPISRFVLPPEKDSF